jgi:uncharacterized protein YjiS (DUF1127 family)
MTMTAVTQSNDNEFGSAHQTIETRGRLHRLWREFARMLVARQLRQALRAMPDWLLHDIGVNRSDIDAVAVCLVDGAAVHTPRIGF